MWGEFAPGQPVKLRAGLGEGRITGLYPGPAGRQLRVRRRGDHGFSTVIVSMGTVESAEPVPVYEVGDGVLLYGHGRCTVVDRWERDDAPGFMYRVTVPHRSRITVQEEPSTATVGAESILGPWTE